MDTLECPAQCRYLPHGKLRSKESIYNMVPRTKIVPVRAPMYVSPHVDKVKVQMAENKQSHKGMGPEKVPLRGVDCYLRAHEKEFCFPPKRKFEYPEPRKPRIPKDAPPMNFKSSKDFITANAMNVICAIPKNPARIYVDTKKGDKNMVDPSGLVPKYIAKKSFGKVPGYVVKRNQEMDAAKQDYADYVNAVFAHQKRQSRPRAPTVREGVDTTDCIPADFTRGTDPTLPEDERQRIISGLKTNWERHNREFLALPMILDTISQVQRKERLEREMAQLEKDIDLIESHTSIYID